MSRYAIFARFYDLLTQNVDYAQRAQRLDKLIRRSMPMPQQPLLLDLACGTGSLAVELLAAGYDIIGVDASPDMLSVAGQKLPGALLLCQDMRKLDLYGTVDVTVCALDSINHLQNEQALDETFARVALFTAPGGLFLFDVNTAYKHREVLGNSVFVFDTDEVFCTWQNQYSAQNDCVEITLDFFVPGEKDTYRRYTESFVERIFEHALLAKLLEKHGFELLEQVFETEEAAREIQRVLYLARRKAK
jgi:Methylase involved in ubiquinone/menaquinone biosynthesis